MNTNTLAHVMGAAVGTPFQFATPAMVCRTTLIGTAAGALQADLRGHTLELAEAFRKVDAAIPSHLIAYVTLTHDRTAPYGAVIADQTGQLQATATARTQDELAALIRRKVQAPKVGHGEAP
jgi:hypothetical protein